MQYDYKDTLLSRIAILEERIKYLQEVIEELLDANNKLLDDVENQIGLP